MVLFLERSCQERDRALPCVGGIGGAISVFVVGILETVAGVIVNLDVDFLAHTIQRRPEFVHVVGGDAAVLCSEQAKDGSIDFLQRFEIGGEMAVVDDVGGESGFLPGDSIPHATHSAAPLTDPRLPRPNSTLPAESHPPCSTGSSAALRAPPAG